MLWHLMFELRTLIRFTNNVYGMTGVATSKYKGTM